MNTQQRIKNREWGMLLPALLCVLIAGTFTFPSAVHAYAQSTYYGQSTYYAQSAYYAQGYYQGYYQPTYKTTVTVSTGVTGGVTVIGRITKGSGTFAIDDPIDPANKILYHSFVESPDAKNIYDGIATLDRNGNAVVALPDYFDALNNMVRYQVKPIGAPMPNLYIKEEEHNNQFGIGGGVPGGKVSWQITGIRHDAYILSDPIIPEVKKGPEEIVDRGQYVYPAGFATPLSKVAGSIRSFLQFSRALW